jgi:hypothetical protein
LDVPIVASITTDAAGLATIVVTATRFDIEIPEVEIGGARLPKGTDPPGPGQFCVVDKETLRIRIQSPTPHAQYLVHIRPAPGKSTLQVWVGVP